jgi:hypothetical protein
MKLTQKNFDKLTEYMNHRMTDINEKITTTTERTNSIEKNIFVICEKQVRMEYDLKWVKKIMAIQTTILGGLFISILGLILKFVLS